MSPQNSCGDIGPRLPVLSEVEEIRRAKLDSSLTIPPTSARIIKVLRKNTRVPAQWACGAAGSALPWHGRGRRFDPDQVHQFPAPLRSLLVFVLHKFFFHSLQRLFRQNTFF